MVYHNSSKLVMIRKATLDDLDTVKQIAEACALFMSANGIHQWNEHYPSKRVFKNDIQEEALYVIIADDGILCGCIMFSNKKDALYDAIEWLTPDSKNLYVHRLAVHPHYQGRGMARKLMDFAETQAANQNYTSIRLDTFSQNKRNQRFYEARGFVRLGDVYFPKQSEHPFHCYEKVLKTTA